MPFKFVSQPLRFGLYEPEGIYLTFPCEERGIILQRWGDPSEQTAAVTYNGVPLLGHNGLDLVVSPGAKVLAADTGIVIEISVEANGYERYIKLEHSWGESLYAFLGDIFVDSGQEVGRGDAIARPQFQVENHFIHFGIRIAPYNRFDGWGGFSDPLPFMNPTDVEIAETSLCLHGMAQEHEGLRRP